MTRSGRAAVIAYAAVYVIAGTISFATAYVANNTAAVWIPTGFSLALLIAKGYGFWPSIAIGAFVLNLGDNLLFARGPLPTQIAVALAVAAGNTAEALLGALLARRFAGGVDLLAKPVRVVLFAALCATLPPFVSMIVGSTASFLGGFLPASRLPEVMLTWFLANAVGVLILVAPLIALFSRTSDLRPRDSIRSLGRALEAVALIGALLFASQAMNGIYIVAALRNWPRAYMVIPLLLWAVFRFGTRGVSIAILLIGAVSIIGTMKGFEAFPAATYSRSLLYLQLFLGLLSVTTLAITAALKEIDELQIDLETLLSDRTGEVERLARSSDLFAALVAHELQSPLQSMRNVLRAAEAALKSGSMATDQAAMTMTTIGDHCAALTARCAELLGTRTVANIVQPSKTVPLRAMVERIAAAHDLNMKRLVIRLDDPTLDVRRPAQVECILDNLIGNAVKHGPNNALVEVCGFRHGDTLEVLVIDSGRGADPAVLSRLFCSDIHPVERRSGGHGLFLASEQAIELGGRLTYRMNSDRTTFRLILPL